jgi:ectoine hydroxylase-related dioxygenase (phytanoyl-CoA dioxygenase family)
LIATQSLLFTARMNEPSQTTEALTRGEGFHVLKQLIEPATAHEVRDYVLAHLDEAQENQPGDTNLINLLDHGPMFESLVTNPRLLAVVHELLGEDAKLAAFSAKTLMPRCGKGRLHVDYPYWAMDPGMPVEPALMMQVIWMMQPVNSENGGTWVAPGSTHYKESVDINRFKDEAVQISGDAGDAFVSHGLLWHQTAINHSSEPRVAVLINFSQLAIRPMRDMGPFSDKFLANASPALKQLLPVDLWGSFRKRLEKNF